MSINSVFNAGVSGMQASQQKMAGAAHEIARATVTPEPAGTANPGTVPNPVANPAENARAAQGNESARTRSADLVEPLIEMRRQEQLFTASAKIVSVADKTLGSLIDVTS